MKKNQSPSQGEVKKRNNRLEDKKSKDELKAQASIDSTKSAYISLMRLYGILN